MESLDRCVDGRGAVAVVVRKVKGGASVDRGLLHCSRPIIL